MQRKTLLSACIALALSGQGWAADITEIETTTGEKKNTNVTCPADPGKLSPEELKRLPSECSSVVEQNLMPWLVTGAATALITTLAIVELNDDDDHHRNNSPLPPTPPDDDSDDTPVPPTPGGDEIIPDDGPDDTPTPPKPISFNNDVILDKTEKTLTIRDSVFTYTENADGTISLQDSNGRKATINLWQIDETNNTVALEGMSADGATKWQYNHNGELVITGDNTTVNNTGKTIVDGKGATGTEIAGNNAVVNQDGELDVSGGGHGIDITGDSATVDNKGGMTVTDPDSIGIQIDGDKAVVNNDGDNAISNGGTGTQVNGDEATVNNNGSTTVDGKDSTGTEINGDKAIVNNDGDSTILDGGTGTRITGDDATANNSGNTTVDGQGSTGTEIAGNNAVVNQDGELDVSGGGHGIDITGDSATVDNKGGMTVTDPDSIGIQIDGDKAVVNNDGDNAISNGGTGTQVNGDEATVNNNGNTTVDGKDSTGTEINGDKAIVNNDGDSTILDGGTGTRITGDDATANNSGNTTVDGQGSTGTEIAGNNAVVNQDGELDVSGGGHGIDITGDSATVDNKGGMTVTDPDSIGIQIDGDKAVVNNDGDNAISNGGTGTQVNGDEATVNNNGSTTVDGQGSTGTEIAGNNAVVNQDGELDVSGGGHGIDITGDSATVDNKGGMTVTDPDSIGIQIDGDKAVVNNDGDSAISNGGTGTQINGDEATVNNNGSTTVDGQGSTGTEIAGNNAVVNQDGELDVSGGGHGIDITGDSATVDNKGGMTVADADSIGIQIDGDKAVVNNDGDNAISNGGTGTQVNGDEATVNNNGNTTVDGKDSTGTEINGDKAIVNNDGDSTILDGGTGTRITGDDATANNSGNTTVDGQGSTGTEIAGNNAVVNQDGELDVSGGGHGIDITGDSATVDNKGGMTVADADSIGIQIDGDKAVVNNDGDNAISNGGTGTQVNGDEATVNNNGNTTVDGKDSTGTEINGDKAIVNNDGDSTILDGGTGTRITGDDATANNSGNTTVDGQGSTGTEIAGNNAVVNQDGELDVSGGGHGIDITGDSATVDNKGGMTVADADSIGIQIDGDKAVVNNDGDNAISNGGTGTQVNGDEATVNNNGNTTVDGKDSTGTEIAGNNATVTQEGELTVSSGGRGIDITGNNAKVDTKGKMTITGTDSVGVSINGDSATLTNTGDIDVSNSATGFSLVTNEGIISLAGSMKVGDFSTGMALSGDNNSVTLAAKDINVTGQKATGVNISGESNTVDITGNILVDKDQTADNAVDYFYDPSVGVNISGNSNTVSLDGKLTVIADSELTSRKYMAFDGSQENISGLTVSGDGNTVNLNGGIQFVGEKNALADGSTIAANRSYFGNTPLVSVDGQSKVYLNGDSTISGSLPLGYANILQLSNKAALEIGSDATFSMQDISVYEHYFAQTPQIIKVDTGSQVVNNGDVDIWNISFAGIWGENSTGINNGNITLSQYDYSSPETPFSEPDHMAFLSSSGGSAVNNGTITAKVMEQHSVLDMGAAAGVADPRVFNNSVSSMMGMEAYGKGTVLNSENGVIDMYGRGNIGMLAIDNSVANNAGKITLDTLWVDQNDTTTLRTDLPSNTAIDYGVGMATGTNSGGGARSNGVATNQQGGVITVYNAGAAMAAYGASNMVINQGIINLEKNGNYDGGLGANMLVGMAVYSKGTAINDKTGVININVDTGQAFYNDGTGTILNYGEINLLGSPMDSADSHMGAIPENLDLLTALTGSGETDMRTASSGGFVTTKALANYGNETLNSNVAAKAWLYNQDKANLTINGELSIGQGLENSGLLDSDTISAAANVYNRASGSIITDQLSLTGSNSFFNEGNFSGSVAGSSYKQNVVNTGTMAVMADGKSLISGSFLLYNEVGATLSNSSSAVSGGENAIVNVTRTGDSLAQVNRGTITAVNGYSAIKTASTGSNSNGKWIWNTDTGVISGVNPNAPLIDLGRGYNFANAGTINVQGDGAVAISGGTTSYTVQLVNSGTINVGTAQGKADGTNGTGLIGIKGNGSDTTINNAQSGVINVYADNSWAFGGKTKAIINNGEINLLCDTGCDIYAPGTTGTLNDHNSTTDIIVPAATSTPTQGSVPTVPADSSAQQKLTNYTIGTNSDGTSGMLKANNLVISDNVKVNTGFSAGTADTTVVINDVFKGENISGAENISSSTVMWNAQGSTDASGNVDVTMTKNAYTDVVTDSSVNNVAQVLDSGYTNNDLYTSLNVGTTAELNSALKQISGSQATTVFNEARVLSNRFSMLSDAAPEVANGLAFNVVAKGDPRAELGNDTQYDMMALRKSLTLTEHQNLSLEYGIARLEGNGSDTAGDNGVTGGYSQFFGLKHQMAFDNGMSWNNALRYDVHNLDSSRSIAYGDVNKTADANVKQQYLEFRSEGAKTFELREGLNVTPYAGVKLRHTLENGYQERNAGDFNLSMNSGSETAVDSIVGLKLDYAGKEGWSANATLEGGPNLSYVKSQRTASISGAGSQRFNIDDGQSGGGFNSLATMGVKYSSQESALQLDAFHWKEDGISDKGVMLNFKKTF
ncbi:EntS/YbdA MFS transporter [Escherichia coli]|uniref:BigA/YdbA N-terminal beta-barrel domain-containing protein n=1 Tax=Escherichia coli TaxID=562 RepID=UPI00195D195A|nr:EntS/YbdA MFS transporter [Escherichia coli]QRT72069.1 EntS/YbdA MFS transporter [Escherichia coli]